MATPSLTTNTTPTTPSPSPSPAPASPLMGWAAIFNALAWPITIIFLALILREKLPALGRTLLGRITEVGFAGFSLKLAEAKKFDLKWSTSSGALDLRSKATATEISDKTEQNFIRQLKEFDRADYAIINLGDGKEWLTSRLYIMAIVLGRMKSLEALVFLGFKQRFIGWAEPEKVRWALAKNYPYLESAYAKAYADITRSSSDIIPPGFPNPIIPGDAIIVDTSGRLGYKSDHSNPESSTNLIQAYLERIQSTSPPLALPEHSEELNTYWTSIDKSNTYEHAIWLTTNKLEALLDEELRVTSFDKEAFEAKTPEEQTRLVLSTSYRWLALTTDKKFDSLSDRNLLLKQICKQVTKST